MTTLLEVLCFFSQEEAARVTVEKGCKEGSTIRDASSPRASVKSIPHRNLPHTSWPNLSEKEHATLQALRVAFSQPGVRRAETPKRAHDKNSHEPQCRRKTRSSAPFFREWI